VGQVTEQVVKGNDSHGGQGWVCERDMACVRVGHGMAGQNYCVICGCLLSLTLCRRAFQDSLKVRPSSVDFFWVHFKFSSFPDEPIRVSGFGREEFCVL
jgi:hypothetical protein